MVKEHPSLGCVYADINCQLKIALKMADLNFLLTFITLSQRFIIYQRLRKNSF